MKKTSIISSSILVLTVLFIASQALAEGNPFQGLKIPTINNGAQWNVSIHKLKLAFSSYEECVDYQVEKICEKQGYSDVEECIIQGSMANPPKAYSIHDIAEQNCIKMGFMPEPTPAPTS